MRSAKVTKFKTKTRLFLFLVFIAFSGLFTNLAHRKNEKIIYI